MFAHILYFIHCICCLRIIKWEVLDQFFLFSKLLFFWPTVSFIVHSSNIKGLSPHIQEHRWFMLAHLFCIFQINIIVCSDLFFKENCWPYRLILLHQGEEVYMTSLGFFQNHSEMFFATMLKPTLYPIEVFLKKSRS